MDAREPICHVLLTRFSYRGRPRGSAKTDGGDWHASTDPLSPSNLAFRLLLFEIVCLPSVLAQTCQDFEWVLIVDEALDPESRSHLEGLVNRRGRTHLHVYRGENLTRLAWLEPYLASGCRKVVTTLLDADDALPRRFAAALRERVGEFAREAPARIFGCCESIQWDLIYSRGSELGYWAPWHRTGEISRPPMSCGFSLLVANRPGCPSVLRLSHRYGEAYFDLEQAVPRAQDQHRRELMAMFGDEGDLPWGGLRRDELYSDLSPAIGPVVMTNHFLNDQWARLFEHKQRRPVGCGDGFPEAQIEVDWELARAQREQLKLSPRVALGIAKRACRHLYHTRRPLTAKVLLASTIVKVLVLALAGRYR